MSGVVNEDWDAGTPPPLSDPEAVRDFCSNLEFECSDAAFEFKLALSKRHPGAMDNLTHLFACWEEFEAWKVNEEQRLTVAFVKRTAYGSKKDPPLFKKHTTFVCSRQPTGGKSKYVKRESDRRTRTSCKLQEGGCPASMNVRTFHDSQVVYVAYAPDHSHDIGQANHSFIRPKNKKRKSSAKSHSASPLGHAIPTNDVEPGTSTPSLTPAPTQPYGVLDAPSTKGRLHEAFSLFAEVYDRARWFTDLLPSFGVLETAISQLHSAMVLHDSSTSRESPGHQHNPTSSSLDVGRQRTCPADFSASTTPSSSPTTVQRWMQAAQGLSTIRHFSTFSELPDPAVTLLEASLFQLFLESTAIPTNQALSPSTAGGQDAEHV
ncbi:hypothetical protein BD626DRAFT_486191 [Schizophyllum amplum]|uniref:FAR1 domain-containing protein n=1 Tax=Schizophyllum amplum TaxID=97359 RepID=A0A550CM90_9AGAR|nr:hypothetical protein BD626DRAFT_486191 [Auriculariopsis ampla]